METQYTRDILTGFYATLSSKEKSVDVTPVKVNSESSSAGDFFN